MINLTRLGLQYDQFVNMINSQPYYLCSAAFRVERDSSQLLISVTDS